MKPPAEALPEIVRFVEQMLVERGYDLVNPVVVEGEDPDIVRDFLAARDLVAETEAGTASPEDIDIPLENLTEIHDYLVEDRRPP
jgi:hypothetical protein